LARAAAELKNKGAKLNTNVQTIAINPMIARNYNVDFDGDGMGYTNLQSEQAKRDFHKLFIANNIKLYFDPDSYIPELTHEAVYTLWAVTEKLINNSEQETVKRFENFRSVKIKSSEFEEAIFKNVYIESVNQEKDHRNALSGRYQRASRFAAAQQGTVSLLLGFSQRRRGNRRDRSLGCAQI